MGIFGGTSTPDYPHGNNAQSGENSGTRHGTSKTIWGPSGGHVQDGGTYGGAITGG